MTVIQISLPSLCRFGTPWRSLCSVQHSSALPIEGAVNCAGGYRFPVDIRVAGFSHRRSVCPFAPPPSCRSIPASREVSSELPFFPWGPLKIPKRTVWSRRFPVPRMLADRAAHTHSSPMSRACRRSCASCHVHRRMQWPLFRSGRELDGVYLDPSWFRLREPVKVLSPGPNCPVAAQGKGVQRARNADTQCNLNPA